MNSIVFLGAALAVKDLAPVPDNTNAPAAVIIATTSTTEPAIPQRSRRDRGDTLTGYTPGAQPSPIGTTVPYGAGWAGGCAYPYGGCP